MTPPLKPHGGQDGLGGAERGDVSPDANGGATEPYSGSLFIPAVVQFMNLNQRMHWAEKARLTKAWRNAAHVHARGSRLPTGLQRIHITAHIIKPTNRAYDAHNLIPTVKAIIDGLVDCNLIPDDTNKHLTGPDMREGGKGEAGVRLEIKEIK